MEACDRGGICEQREGMCEQRRRGPSCAAPAGTEWSMAQLGAPWHSQEHCTTLKKRCQLLLSCRTTHVCGMCIQAAKHGSPSAIPAGAPPSQAMSVSPRTRVALEQQHHDVYGRHKGHAVGCQAAGPQVALGAAGLAAAWRARTALAAALLPRRFWGALPRRVGWHGESGKTTLDYYQATSRVGRVGRAVAGHPSCISAAQVHAWNSAQQPASSSSGSSAGPSAAAAVTAPSVAELRRAPAPHASVWR